MAVDAIHVGNQNEAVNPNPGISFNEIAQLKLIESLISVIQSYLETVQKSYDKMAIQDKDHEHRVKTKKAHKKGLSEAKMDDFKDSDIGRESGNSMIPKASDSSIISSGSVDNGESPSLAGLGFSYA